MGLELFLRKCQRTKTHLGGPEVDKERHAEGAKVPNKEKMKFGKTNKIKTFLLPRPT